MFGLNLQLDPCCKHFLCLCEFYEFYYRSGRRPRENMLLDVDRIIILSGLHSVIKKLLARLLSFLASYTVARFTLRFFPHSPCLTL